MLNLIGNGFGTHKEKARDILLNITGFIQSFISFMLT